VERGLTCKKERFRDTEEGDGRGKMKVDPSPRGKC